MKPLLATWIVLLVACTPSASEPSAGDDESTEQNAEQTAEPNAGPNAEQPVETEVDEHEQHAGHEHAAADEHEEPAEFGHMAVLPGLQLNNGARWQMDEHTRQMIVTMNTTLEGVSLDSPADATRLGTALQGQLQQLFQGCTMQGAAHDSLHVFLTDYIPAVDRLAESTDMVSATHALQTVRGLLTEYALYFE